MIQSVQTSEMSSENEKWKTTGTPGPRRFPGAGPGAPDAVANLGAEFLESAHRHADQPAFISDDRTVTYRDLQEMTVDYALTLAESFDWSPGSCVALQLENTPEYIAAFYGILIAGGVVVPLPTGQTEAWVNHVLQATQSRWIVDRDGLHSCLQRLSIRRTPSYDNSALLSRKGLAAIFFTSGSSGAPKGVMLSHVNLLSNAVSIQQSLPIETTDRTLALLPFCHAFGNSVLQSHLLCGAALVVAGSTAFPETLLDAMRTHAVTSFSGVPQLHLLIFRGSAISSATLPALRYATVAGGALRSDQITEFASRIAPAKFFVMYGQTEATARLSCLPAEELPTRCGSIGKGIPGVTLQVVDEKGRNVAPGSQGEIRAHGRNLMLGYWNDAKSTEEILRDGWLYTGDLATVDEDGFIYPQGRKSQLLKIAGYRIHPAEIEAAITKVIDTIDAIVVPFESVDGSQRLAMFVIPLRTDRVPDMHDIRRCCMHHLARFQRPDYISLLEHAPLTPSLKVDRQELSRWATEAVRQRSRSDLLETVTG
jgi:long-chain acyl-CoA synthetase